MYCPSCGAQADGGASFCTPCGASIAASESEGQTPGGVTPPVGSTPPQGGESYTGIDRPSIPTYLPYAILVTLFCCLPLGIPAIIYAARVSSRLGTGDIQGAQADSKEAKKWTWISFWVGIAAWVIYGGFLLLVAILDEAG
jgi:hypothetical protein